MTMVFRGSADERADQLRLALLLSMTVALTASLAVFLRKSGFMGSDFLSFGDAQRDGLTFGYLMRPVFGHFVPGHRFVNWILYSIAPLDFRLAIAVSLGCFTATLFVMHRLLAELFRPRMALLLLTLFYGASAIQIGTAQWWAASLSRLPAELFSLACVLLHLRFRRTQRLSLLVWSVAFLGVALLFSEHALLVPVFLVALRLLILHPEESLSESLRGAFAEWRLWLPYLIPIAVSIIGSSTQTNTLYDFHALGSLARYLGAGWFHTFAPALIGQFVDAGALSGTEMAIAALAQVVVLGVVALTILRRPVAVRAWAFFAIGFLITQAPVGLIRTGFFTPELVAHQYRYYSHTIILFTIALGAALFPVRHQAQEERHLTWRERGWVAVGAVSVVALAYVAGSVWTSTRVANSFPGRQAGPYLDNLRHDLREARRAVGRFGLVDGELPNFMIVRLFAPNNRVAAILPLIGDEYDVATTGPNLYRVRRDGHLEPVTFTPRAGGSALNLAATQVLAVVPAESQEAEDGRICARSGTQQAAIGYQLPMPVGPGDWYLRVSYRTSDTGIAHVLVDRGSGFVSAADPALPIVPHQHEGVVALGNEGFARVIVVLQPDLRICFDQFDLALVERRDG